MYLDGQPMVWSSYKGSIDGGWFYLNRRDSYLRFGKHIDALKSLSSEVSRHNVSDVRAVSDEDMDMLMLEAQARVALGGAA